MSTMRRRDDGVAECRLCGITIPAPDSLPVPACPVGCVSGKVTPLYPHVRFGERADGKPRGLIDDEADSPECP